MVKNGTCRAVRIVGLVKNIKAYKVFDFILPAGEVAFPFNTAVLETHFGTHKKTEHNTFHSGLSLAFTTAS